MAFAVVAFTLQTVVVLVATARHLRAGRLRSGPDILSFGTLEAFLSSEVAAVLKHVAGIGVQRPEGSLARLVGCPWYLEEAIVEAERMSDGVLPALLVLTVERKQVHDELVNLTKGQHFTI